ncbi:MAG: hypothetical protein ABII12_15475 [Planctomycetota bacterium]
MNLTKTTVVLIGVLILLIAVSAYLWAKVGLGEPEVDSNVASSIQHFTCGECGHAFEMRISQVAAMRRARGEIICPKCEKGGAQKVASPESAGEARETSAPSPSKSSSRKESEDAGESPPEVSNQNPSPPARSPLGD